MADDDSLRALEGIHRDLCALLDHRLPTLDRLLGNVEAHVQEFQALIDKKPKSDGSRKQLAEGKITVGEQEFGLNEEFQHLALEMAEALHLDEMEAAAYLIGAQAEATELDRTQLQTAIIRFHRRREYVLLCVRMLLKANLDDDESEMDYSMLQVAVQLIVGVHGANNLNAAFAFWAKCLESMAAIESWLQHIAERIQSAHVVGQVPLPGFMEIMTFQRQSLTRQHENLAAICTHMVKPGFAGEDNLRALLGRAKSIDKHDLITIHYVPMLIALISHVAQGSMTNIAQARAFHNTLMTGRDSDQWVLRNLHAATLTWWLAEYSGRYVDANPHDQDLANVNFEEEAIARSEAFLRALEDGAYHFVLSVSQDVRPTRWYDPQKTSMISSLLQDTAVLPLDSPQPEEFFKELVMEQLQTFVDSFITNMPDTLRRLKVEEDDQRRRLQMHFGHSGGEYPLHLERFLVIVSYAFDGFPDAAEDFWADKESNLYGFLQWAAKRQPTPRIAMFCEMLRAISTGDANADSAHRFLLEESAASAGRIRRTSSLSYTHIFNELIEFQTDIHEPKMSIRGHGLYPPNQNPVDQIVEPESAIMLESYLRLLAHLCRESRTARLWLLDSQEYNLAGICFGLCADKIESGLRASAFDAVSALLVEKDVLRATAVWNNLDDWTISGFYVGSKQSSTASPYPRDELWATMANGYDESIAFIRLLQALVEPYASNMGLNDTLPFPEGLGSARRMPGIEKYIDFVMQQVFAERSPDVQDPLQRSVMRWTCLQFIGTCLRTFNENLVVFANKSNLPVDEIIDSSSLAIYVTLHPFTRVIEWLFNDKVVKALFESSHYDVNEVDAAPTDSPLVQSLLLSIDVMDQILRLQATYLDIVRPVLRKQTFAQSSPVANASLASFEDAILNNLRVIVDLGLYCGTGHESLTIASLQLLEKMASSRKLAVSPAGFGQRSGRSKIVGILEKDNESERIGRSLSSLMKFSTDELESQDDAPGYIIKLRILDFLNSCLAAVSQRPTIAHILLGFSCGSTAVHIAEDSLWTSGNSLFHAILILAVNYPDNDGESFSAWMSEIKTKSWEVLQRLWRSPLTRDVVMEELRTNELLFIHAPTLIPISPETPWDGLSLVQGLELLTSAQQHSFFFHGPPAKALQNFLQQRAAFLDYESRELRLTVKEGMPSMRSRIQSVLLGTTIRPGEDPVPNATIFDLFDFIEMSYPEMSAPDHELLQGISLASCQEDKDGVQLFSRPLLEQFFLLKMKYYQKYEPGNPEIPHLAQDAEALLLAFEDCNRHAQLARFHKDILQSWVQLLMVALHACEFDSSSQTTFILQTLQVILPKLELSYDNDLYTALQLAGLGEALIEKIDFDSTAFERTRNGDFANDRLSQLFRAALVGIYSPVSTVELREYCYQICFRYIQGTFEKATKGSLLGRHTLNTIKNCGTNVLEVICDDAYSGEGMGKVSALLLLNALVSVAARQESKYILESFVTLNFVGVLVDNIKHMADELKAASAPQIPTLLSYYDSNLALLLRICQTRLGATYVLNASLFPAVRDSRLFAVDPDIGLEFDNPKALKKYYELMLAVLRVINAAVIVRGRQNDQTVFQGREFLKESRPSMVAIFKRSVNVGAGLGQDMDLVDDLRELVDCFTVLVDVTGFLEYEDSASQKLARGNMFS